MFLLRCLHPPGGAVAVVSALATPAVVEAGYGFVLAPVALNSVLLLATAIAFNNLTGRAYPHPRAKVGDTVRTLPSERIGFTLDDLDAVLKRHDEVFDIDRHDLATILTETSDRAYGRRHGELTCADFMTSDVASAAPDESLDSVWRRLLASRIKALPVVGSDRELLGIVTQTDFLQAVGTGVGARAGWLAGRRPERALRHGFSPRIAVRTIMSSPVRTARPETTLPELVRLMSDQGMHQLPVVDDAERLVGIVTQSDMIAALFFGPGRLAEAGVAA